MSSGRRRTRKRMKSDSKEEREEYCENDQSFEVNEESFQDNEKSSPLLHVPPLKTDFLASENQVGAGLNSENLQNVLFGLENGEKEDVSARKNGKTDATTIDTTAVLKKAPAFLQKLYAMLNDPDITDIVWSDDGESFSVTHPENLAKTVLPFYFKHNNFTSFIRQLNMYGFRKFSNLVDGSMVANALQMDALAFRHENFKKSRPDLLANITRKKSTMSSSVVHVGGDDDDTDMNIGVMASGNKKKKDIDFDMILNEMNQIKMQQLAISHEIASIQGQNQLMWAQSRDLQIQYNNQKDTVEKILGFLASVFSKKQGVGGATVPVPSEVIGQKRKLITEGILENSINNDIIFNPDNLSFNHPIDHSQIPPFVQPELVSSLFPTSINATTSKVADPSPFAQVIPPTDIPIPFDIQEKVNGVAQDIELLDDRVFEISNLVGDLNGSSLKGSTESLLQDDGGFFDFINQEVISGGKQRKGAEMEVSSVTLGANPNETTDFDDFFNDPLC